MKKPTTKSSKLALNTDTVRHLVKSDLQNVIGGLPSGGRHGSSECPNPSGG